MKARLVIKKIDPARARAQQVMDPVDAAETLRRGIVRSNQEGHGLQWAEDNKR